MNQIHQPPDSLQTMADLLENLGEISPSRVRLSPAPGTATEQDLLNLNECKTMLCELVDGVLVEKAVGFRESLLAAALIAILKPFVKSHNLGLVLGADGMLRLEPGLIRLPDVSFISWQRLQSRKVPQEAVPTIAPDLAVEVLSKSNTAAEMARKRQEYFAAGSRLVWLIDPVRRTVAVYNSPEESQLLEESATLEGGDVLPGFTLPLKELFSELDQQAEAPTNGNE